MKTYWVLLSPWKKIKLIFSIIVTLLILIFAIENWKETEVSFIFNPVKIKVTLLILTCLVAGFLTSTLFDYRKYLVKDREISNLNSEILRLKSKISSLEEEIVKAE